MAPTSQHSGYAPTLEKFLHTDGPLEATLDTAVSLLKRRQIAGPESCARAIAHVLSKVVAGGHWADAAQLLDSVVQTGRRLADAQPQQPVIGNVVCRVLGLVRDEADADEEAHGSVLMERAAVLAVADVDLRIAATTAAAAAASLSSPVPTTPSLGGLVRTVSGRLSVTPSSMFSLLLAAAVVDASAPGSSLCSNDASTTGSGASTPRTGGGGGGGSGSENTGTTARATKLRDEILDGIAEIVDEIGQADDQVAGFADAQIRPGDGVLVLGGSSLTHTVEKFLIKSAARRRYTLFVLGSLASTAPTLIKRLAAAHVTVTHVSGSAAVVAYMPRVHRVVLDALAITAGGGVLVGGGGARLARAAHAHHKTVLVLGGVYRLSPAAWMDPMALVLWSGPAVRFSDGDMVDGVVVASAVTEYVPPELVDIYVTNLGPHSKEQLETVIADHYKPQDADLFS